MKNEVVLTMSDARLAVSPTVSARYELTTFLSGLLLHNKEPRFLNLQYASSCSGSHLRLL